jgi:hypothetical protein
MPSTGDRFLQSMFVTGGSESKISGMPHVTPHRIAEPKARSGDGCHGHIGEPASPDAGKVEAGGRKDVSEVFIAKHWSMP